MTKLLNLPNEVLTSIVEECVGRDQARLARVHPSFKSIVVPILYRRFTLTFECGVSPTLSFECVLKPGNAGVNYIRELAVTQVCDDKGFVAIQWGVKNTAAVRSANNIYTAALLLLRNIPKDRLTSFRWKLPIPLSTKIYNELHQQQKCITQIQFPCTPRSGFPTEHKFPPMAFEQLTSLEIHHVFDINRVNLLAATLPKCRELKHLALGFDKDRLDMDMESRSPGSSANFDFLRGQMLVLNSIAAAASESEGDKVVVICPTLWPNLESLCLNETSVHCLSTVVVLGRLKSLALNECSDTDNFLQQWTTDKPNLKRFHVKPTVGEAQGVVDQLGHFLKAFNGLKELSYFHRAAPPFEWQFKSTLENHLTTLETLVVWDNPITTDRPSLRELCTTCPRLHAVAVKLSFDWLETAFTKSTSSKNIAQVIARVRHFRVLNQRQKCTAANRHADATTIAHGAIRAANGNTCRLELLIMQNGDLLDCFHVQVVRNVLGDHVPLVTRVDPETARRLVGSVDVLDPRAKFLL